MGSRREEERNEKIIRGLMKLPPNRRCINCNSLGPQYVCTNFWTFVCMTCSGIHREFTHRVKSVSMAKFTSQEVDALQKGGNQRARELYLKAWDSNRQRLPDNSNVDKVREFIKNVYVEKRYAVEKSSDRPPRDSQKMRSHEDETRRASSYHSYSQSPPYDFQCEEWHSGKQRATSLSRKPGSDHLLYKGRFSCFSSPSRLSNCGNDERFENKGSFHRSFSTSDTFKCSMLSPSPQRDIGSPFSETSSFVSRDSTPWHPLVQSNADANNGNNEEWTMHQQEGISEPRLSLEMMPHGEASSVPSSLPESSMFTTFSGVDLLSEPIAPRSAISTQTTLCKTQLSTASAVDFFLQSPISSVPTFSEQQSVASSIGQTCDAVICSNGEWTTFDNPQNSMPADASILALVPYTDGKFNPFSDDQISSSNDSIGHENSASTYALWDANMQNLEPATNNNQFCNAFEESSGQQPIQNMLKSSHQDTELSSSDANKPLGFAVALNNDGIVKTSDDIEPPAYISSHYNVALHDFSMVPAVSPEHSFATEHKPTNPFDLPFDSDLESSNMISFWEMSLLQSALPDSQISSYGFDASQSWFLQHSVQSYLPDGAGPFGFIVGQVRSTSMSSFHAQGPVASVGGNPFA